MPTLTIIQSPSFISQYIAQIQDLTQPWNAITNPTGWCYDVPVSAQGDNPYIRNIASAISSVTLPNGTIPTPIDLLAGVSALYNITDSLIVNPFIITPTMLGFTTDTTAFTDGKYIFYLQVTGSYGTDPVTNFNANPTNIVYNTATVKCCVDELRNRVDPNKKVCGNPAYDLWLKAWTIYKGILNEVSCAKYDEADTLLEQLQSLCARSGCQSCGCA